MGAIQQVLLSQKIAGGGGLASFSDDFNRANGPVGANWTVDAGTAAIVSNAMALQTLAFGKHAVLYTATGLSTTQGYAKGTWTGTNVYPEIIFRFTNTASPYYSIQILDDGTNAFEWKRYADVASAGSTIATSASIPLTGKTIGITWTGTGTGTIIRVWVNPTAAAPTSVSSWDGGADPSDRDFTTDPPSPVDSGAFVGLGGYHNSAISWENFSGGDAP